VTVKKAVVFASVVTALLFASVALAGGSSLLSGYGGQEVVQAHVSGAQHAPVKGTLPFTGLELVPIAVGGAALVLIGATLRRSARRKS
jgi:hypothetical protein